MKSGSALDLLGLVSEGDTPLGDFCFEFVDGRNVLVDEKAAKSLG